MLANVSVTPVCHVNVTKVYLFSTSWPSIPQQSYNHASNQREDPKGFFYLNLAPSVILDMSSR